ncbi:MAG: polysaccharide export protein [Proteobacteria bacterium]|nr:polysaccharide export protein [Pseudomonadota bacterium]
MSDSNMYKLDSVWKLYRLFAIAGLFILAGLATCASAADMSGQIGQKFSDSRTYRLSSGDVISITVFDEEDLSRLNYRLPDTGIISFPFGEVRALGLSISELEMKVIEGLRKGYLKNPRVSVSMMEYSPFFVIGQVNKPGGYPYQVGMTVRKAIALAGGFAPRGSESKVFVVREADTQNTQSKIDLDGDVFAGDTVTVEEGFF